MHSRVITNQTQKYDFGEVTISPLDRSLDWSRSARVNGELQLKAHPHLRVHGEVSNYHAMHQDFFAVPGSAGGSVSNAWFGAMQEGEVPSSLSNEVYAKFRGKLYKGNASLGVTLASYGQSRDMVTDRFRMLTGRADVWSKKLEKLAGRRLEKEVAGFHLEVIFGWTPLLADAHSALTSVIQGAYPSQFVSSRGKSAFAVTKQYNEGRLSTTISTVGEYTETWSTRVTVSNPNLWLAERAGLINPVAVAWDLVPWSFVVNMFVNTGQLANSVTDFAGLTFDNFSRTRSTNLSANITAVRRYTGDPAGSASMRRNTKQRELLAGPPGPRLQFQLPDANWSTAAMAASLFIGKFSKIGNFIKPHKSLRSA